MKIDGIMDKIELIKSAVIVADFWEVKPSKLVGFIGTFVKPEKKEQWNNIAKEVQEFYELPMTDRMKKVGFEKSKQTS